MALELYAYLPLGEGTFQDNAYLRQLSKVRPLGRAAALALEEIGEIDLSVRLGEHMNFEEAVDFATELRDTAERLEQQHVQDRPEASLGNWGFEDALAAIREAADWYENVGNLGCEVYPTF